jgi:hypothetical protein
MYGWGGCRELGAERGLQYTAGRKRARICYWWQLGRTLHTAAGRPNTQRARRAPPLHGAEVLRNDGHGSNGGGDGLDRGQGMRRRTHEGKGGRIRSATLGADAPCCMSDSRVSNESEARF